MHKSGHTKVQFSEVMAALLDNSRPFPPTYLYELSDLGESDLVTLKRHWAEIPARRRVALLEDLANLQESNDVLSFERVAVHAPHRICIGFVLFFLARRLLAVQIQKLGAE